MLHCDWSGPTYRTSYLFSKLRRKSELDGVISALRPDDRANLGLSEVLQLIREFAEAEIAPQIIIDKDRHIQNLETQQALLRQAVEAKEQHIQNLDGDIETTLLEDKDHHIVNLEAELAAVRRQTAINADLQFKMRKIEEAHGRLQEKQASLEADNEGIGTTFGRRVINTSVTSSTS